jgi:hypothetical protein
VSIHPIIIHKDARRKIFILAFENMPDRARVCKNHCGSVEAEIGMSGDAGDVSR